MSPRIVIIGGGEHARVILDAILTGVDSGEVAGFVDSNPCWETAKLFRVKCLGDEDALEEYRDLHAVLGFGALETRFRRLEAVHRLAPRVAGWASVVHRSAWISPSSVIGEGSVVMAGVMIQTGARIGAHCVVNTGAVVEHDVVLEDFVQVGPGVTLGGGVRVGANAYIGLGATIRDHINVGPGAVVGMGSVVVRDVPASAQVMGAPAR